MSVLLLAAVLVLAQDILAGSQTQAAACNSSVCQRAIGFHRRTIFEFVGCDVWCSIVWMLGSMRRVDSCSDVHPVLMCKDHSIMIINFSYTVAFVSTDRPHE